MQPSLFIQQTNIQPTISTHAVRNLPHCPHQGSTLHLFPRPAKPSATNTTRHIKLGKPEFASRLSQTTFANQGNQESRYETTARRSLLAGTFPNEVRWKNLLRRLTPCRKSVSQFRMLELAKGFEPLTL
jgi:hypothetical protein